MSQKIFDAIRCNQYSQLVLFLRHGYNFRIKTSPGGDNILMAALDIGDARRRYKMFQFLLEQELVPVLDRNARDQDIFFVTVMRQCERELALLLRYFAAEIDWARRDTDGRTLLHHAVLTNNLGVLESLLACCSKYRVNVDVLDSIDQITPYLLACRLNYNQAADLLLNVGRASRNQADPVVYLDGERWRKQGQVEKFRSYLRCKQHEMNAAMLHGDVRSYREISSLSHKLSAEVGRNPDLLPILAKVIIDYDRRGAGTSCGSGVGAGSTAASPSSLSSSSSSLPSEQHHHQHHHHHHHQQQQHQNYHRQQQQQPQQPLLLPMSSFSQQQQHNGRERLVRISSNLSGSDAVYKPYAPGSRLNLNATSYSTLSTAVSSSLSSSSSSASSSDNSHGNAVGATACSGQTRFNQTSVPPGEDDLAGGIDFAHSPAVDINAALRHTMNTLLKKRATAQSSSQVNSLLEMASGQSTVDHFVSSKSSSEQAPGVARATSNGRGSSGGGSGGGGVGGGGSSHRQASNSSQDNSNATQMSTGSGAGGFAVGAFSSSVGVELTDLFYAAALQQTNNFRTAAKLVEPPKKKEKAPPAPKVKVKTGLSSLAIIREESRAAAGRTRPAPQLLSRKHPQQKQQQRLTGANSISEHSLMTRAGGRIISFNNNSGGVKIRLT